MGRGSGVCKFLGIIFIFSLLVNGSCAAEENDETNTNLNDPINSTLIGTINGTINSTINDATNETIIGVINGTINGTISNKEMFSSILLLPLFLGALIFLFWLCRFFDRMNFCFVIFLLIALLLELLWLHAVDLISKVVPYIIVLILISILYVIYYERKKRDENNASGKSNLIMGLHDILRNFIVIFAVLIWPIVLLYFDRNRINYVTFYGIKELQFPVYIIAASFIGILSYLFLSIEETFGHLIPEYEKMSIVWSYLRRIFIAPFIAIIGFYLLNDLQNRDEFSEINDYFVFVFSFFAGVFTKTIEEWIYAWVQKLLPGAKNKEFSARIKYEVKESDFVKKLGCDEDLAYMLYNAKIRTIEELASFNNNMGILINKVNIDTRNQGEGTNCPLNEMKNTLGSYTEEQLQLYIDRAERYTKMDEISDLVKYLKMDRDLAFKLWLRAGIKDTDGLKNCDPKYVHKKICDYKKESQEVHDRLCECSEDIIQKFKEEAQKEKEKEESKLNYNSNSTDPIN